MAALFGGDLHDEGRFEVTHLQQDRWAYKTPSLRNVALTAPYMHDGSIATLREVIEFYDRGGIDNPGKDSLLQPLHLTLAEKQALEAFLQTLTGENVRQLAAEARAAFHTTGAR
jgi:cytochrome c peroxidase